MSPGIQAPHGKKKENPKKKRSQEETGAPPESFEPDLRFRQRRVEG